MFFCKFDIEGRNKWTKISDLETNIFELKMMVKSGLEFFYFKILLAPSELLLPSAKNLPREAELAWPVSS